MVHEKNIFKRFCYIKLTI